MQRIHNLSKWQYVETSMVFDNPEPRLVKLEVNCPDKTAFYVVREADDIDQDDERQRDKAANRTLVVQSDTTFLGLAEGRDGFEFWVEGRFKLEPSEPCWVFTVDSMRIATEVVAPVVFTRIANRRARNPHLEMMEFQMKRNTEARLRAMEQELERRLHEKMELGFDRYKPERNPRAPAALVGRIEPEEVRDDNAPDTSGSDGTDAPKGDKGGKPAKSGKAAAASDDGGKKAKAD